jgi:hypothetical protein
VFLEKKTPIVQLLIGALIRYYFFFFTKYCEYSLSQKIQKRSHKKKRLLPSYNITYTWWDIPPPCGQSDMGGGQFCKYMNCNIGLPSYMNKTSIFETTELSVNTINYVAIAPQTRVFYLNSFDNLHSISLKNDICVPQLLAKNNTVCCCQRFCL